VAERFRLFAADHLLALASVAALAIGMVLLARAGHERLLRILRISLAASLLGASALYLAIESTLRPLDALDFAPLHLCDMAIFVAVLALLSRSAAVCEVLYFWACSGTVLAMITPDVWYAFPHRHFVAYFALHGAVVIAAIFLTFGLRMRPRPGAPWRVLLITNAYAGAVLIVNLIFGTNFLYLIEKPHAPTLLDLFGPWPIYIAVVELVALACFWILHRIALRFVRS
jgi:hypothetical integral membrane protein (TIGR02206 family)